MKKIFYLLSLTLLVLAICITLFGCGNDETTESSQSNTSTSSSQDSTSSIHEHTYGKGWEKEDLGHYRPCICHPEHKNMSDHIDTVDKNGFCDVCQYEMVKETTITVFVTDDVEQAVQGAEIKIYTQTVEHIETTDQFGSCSGSFVYTNGLKAMIISLPDGYKLPEKTIFSIYEESFTIVVGKE